MTAHGGSFDTVFAYDHTTGESYHLFAGGDYHLLIGNNQLVVSYAATSQQGSPDKGKLVLIFGKLLFVGEENVKTALRTISSKRN